MIEGIKEIGDIIISEAPEKFLENLANEVNSQKQGKKQHIVIVEFDTRRNTINFDYEEIKEETAKKYLWLGNRPSNNPQDRFTTTNLEYLISQTIPNFRILIPGGELGELLEKLGDRFYYDLGPQKGQKERYRYVWDIEKLGISSQSMEELWEKAKKDAKKMVSFVLKEIYGYLKRKKNLNKKEISLFTLRINGQSMVNFSKYRRYLENSMVEELFSDKTTGVCHLCQEEKEITQNMTRFDFKYYITDKIGFASELHEKGFLRNFTLCKNCYRSLLVGESFVKNNLRDYFAGTSLYIIPKFIFDTSPSMDRFKKWVECIKASFSSTTSLEGLRRFQESLEDYLEFEKEKNNFMLNLLFYKKTQSELRILKLIKDVPPSRLDTLRKEENKVHDIGAKLFEESDRWYLTLKKMYYLFPVRMTGAKGRGKEVVGYKKVLEFYDALFLAKPMSYEFLIKQFVELACVYRFEKFDSYNIGKSNSDLGLVHAMLEANLLLLYLRKLNLLEGGETMGGEMNILLLTEEIKDYVEEMGYQKTQTALFLLGYLIGEVGNAQYSPENHTKPILNKITYQGMNIGKIIRLTNEIFEKLKQYRRLSYNEGIFEEMKKLLDRNIKNWDLSDQENVFYILSGYAYNTYKILTKNK